MARYRRTASGAKTTSSTTIHTLDMSSARSLGNESDGYGFGFPNGL